MAEDARTDGPATAADITGTWELTSWRVVGPGDEVAHPMTERARGRVVYDPGGTMAVHLMHPDLPGGTVPGGFIAYSGRFTLRGGEVHHHVDLAGSPELIGRTLSRRVTRDGERLCLDSPAPDDPDRRHVLEWRRYGEVGR